MYSTREFVRSSKAVLALATFMLDSENAPCRVWRAVCALPPRKALDLSRRCCFVSWSGAAHPSYLTSKDWDPGTWIMLLTKLSLFGSSRNLYRWEACDTIRLFVT